MKPKIGTELRKRAESKNGWDKEHFIYYGSDGEYNSFWKTVISSPQWQLWEDEVSRRMSYHSKKKSKIYSGVWDITECRECGQISPEHFQDFLKWAGKKK